ncbi:hypothetical protein V8G54_023077 [Vigna mungo]|uniref:Retrovirus-related Pol polyprotein from transposon TNT 1-94 n=1 Tax=Vigna mungo TaxID=3915 RepID=A0AAQ3N4L2_VIGMU
MSVFQESGLEWPILRRWEVPWEWQTVSLTSLACLTEAIALPYLGIKPDVLSLDDKAEILLLDQGAVIAIALTGVAVSFFSEETPQRETFYPLPQYLTMAFLNQNLNQTPDHLMNLANPLYLHPGENPALVLVMPLLMESNFHQWERDMVVALETKNKERSLPQGLASLQLNGDSWLTRSMTPSIKESMMWMDMALEIWRDLKDRFSHAEKFRIFDLKDQIFACHQGDLSVYKYYTKLKFLWKELELYRCVLTCTCSTQCACGLLSKLHKKREDDYVIRFLRGLNESYSKVRSQIMILDPMPSIVKTFSVVLQDECEFIGLSLKPSVLDSLAFTAISNDPPRFTSSNRINSNASKTNSKNTKLCEKCKKTNHAIETTHLEGGKVSQIVVAELSETTTLWLWNFIVPPSINERNFSKILKQVIDSVSFHCSTVCLVGITGVLAPLLEETVFRGFLMTSLTKWVPTPVAVVISASVFALAHLTPGEFPQLFVLASRVRYQRIVAGNLMEAFSSFRGCRASSPRTQQLAPTVGQGFKNSQGAMATKFDVEKFNGANDFGLWKIKMEAILIQQGCVEALKGESKMSDAMTQEEKKKMGNKARSAIILCLGDKVLREVAKEKTAAEIWVKLESLYMTRSLAHRLCLKQQLFSFKMSESRTIEEQIAEFSKIVDDLENIGVKLEDEDKAVILLNALPKTFEHFRDALLYGKDQVITLEEVLTSIRTKEFQKLQDSKTTEEGASGLIAVKGKGKKQSGKEKKLNPDGTKQVRCFKCQKMGHIKKFCPEKGKAGRPQETADVAEASEGYESAGVLVASSEYPQRSWVMDSGCSYHMCPVKEFFENLDQKEHGNVLLGNNKACRVQGVGSVRLKMFDNREMVLQAVRYVPELKRNLISISAFDLGGYTTKVEDGVMRVCSGDSVVAKGRRRNGLYILEGSTVIGHVSVASGTENTARLWHLRMGHISEKGLEELEKQDLLLGDKLQKLDFCDHCVLGKSHKIPFGKGKHSTERPFEYVHADLWGPARTLTHGGGAYFLSIIDDFSRRVWIYVLKNKSETFQKFKEWHTQIENQLGCRLKCLRTDNGLEFVSEEFNGFCKEKGIRRHRTVVGTPQQNGLAERMNRTILERVRCMLLGSGLSKAFWGEAANTAVYLINRSPSSALNFKTPMEVWSGRPADYSHLRVFGSLAFAHVRGDKLDSRAARCIFLGYADGVKGYRLWRLDSPSKLIISRDVIFDETRMAMHPENSGSEKKILVEVEHTTNGAGTPGGTEENQTGEGQVETGRTIAENRPDEFRTDLGDDTDDMSGEGSHGKAAGVDLRNYQLVRDRERRISKPTKRLGEADLICYALNAAEDINRSDEPRSYKEALDSSDRHLWQGAMEEELEALKKNNTWRLVDLPKGKKVIGSKWIFKKKEATPGGEKARYKARLVAKGFTQIEGVDYHEVFAPVVKHCSVRVLMAIVAHCNLHLEQLDVRTAFLHGDLEETIYMKQPDGFAVDDRVCLLQKSLYGLKQSPRQWYRKFDDFLIKLNFKRCNYDDCVYTLNHGGEMLYLLLYVDDILIASSDRGMIGETKARLADAFEMKELGEARRILGIDIKRDRPGGNLFLSQECYLQKVISRYRMAESKMANTPVGQHLKLTKEQCPKTEEERKKMESVPFSNGIGSIMYGMVCTRPDVAHGVSVLSQFMVNPGPTHWEALKWMLRYIRGSLGTGLFFQNNFQGGGYIEGFVDSDFAGCMDTRKSRSGYVFTLFGTAVSWRSTLQSVVALSTTEAEYYALAEGVKEALWLKGLVRELGFDQKSVCVHCDSQSAIHLANHQIYHSRTKHIDVKLHFVRSIVESGDVQICKIASEENPADMLTKPLAKERFLFLLSRIGCLPVGH